MHKKLITIFILSFTVGISIIFAMPLILSAAVMQSGSYQIQSDSINFGGGFSTSSSYNIQDTLGEIGSGFASSTSYALNAGYQSMQEVYISITDSSDIALPPIGGISGGSTTGQSTWTVITDDPAGYSLAISAATNPALISGLASVSNYSPSGGSPDYTFTIPASSSVFGFSPEGIDLIQRFKDNGSACGTGSGDTIDRCWDGISTTPTIIVQSTTSNHPSGATTTVKYQVGIGSNKIQEAGTYTSNVTVTALAL